MSSKTGRRRFVRGSALIIGCVAALGLGRASIPAGPAPERAAPPERAAAPSDVLAGSIRNAPGAPVSAGSAVIEAASPFVLAGVDSTTRGGGRCGGREGPRRTRLRLPDLTGADDAGPGRSSARTAQILHLDYGHGLALARAGMDAWSNTAPPPASMA